MADNAACCACLHPSYDPIHTKDGFTRERWACKSCGTEFVKRFWLDKAETKLREREAEVARLTKIASNAEAGDCLRGEMGTVECPVDKPCGVCKLTRERDGLATDYDMLRERIAEMATERDAAVASEKRLREALHRISLGSQNPGTSREDLGIDARTALTTAAPKAIKPPQDQPKPPPADEDEPYVRRLMDAMLAGNQTLKDVAGAVLELARRPR